MENKFKDFLYVAIKVAWFIFLAIMVSNMMVNAIVAESYVLFGVIAAINLTLWGIAVRLDIKSTRELAKLTESIKYLKEKNQFYESMKGDTNADH